LCYPRSPRNLLTVVFSWGHDSCVVMSQSVVKNHWNFKLLGYSWRLIVSMLLSQWNQTKTQCIRHLLCFVSELSSSTKPAKSDSVPSFGHRGYSNRDIIGTAISFLSDIHSRNVCYGINQYLTNISSSSWFRFLFLQDNGYTSEAIIISTSPLTSLKLDESRGVSFHISILPSSPPVTMTWFLHYVAQLIRKEKKLMDKLTSSSGNIEMIPIWQFFRSEWRTEHPIDFVGSLELDKPGGVMNAASPLGNVVMPMSGKQNILVRSHI